MWWGYLTGPNGCWFAEDPLGCGLRGLSHCLFCWAASPLPLCLPSLPSAPYSVESLTGVPGPRPLHLHTTFSCFHFSWDFCSWSGKSNGENLSLAAGPQAFLPGRLGGWHGLGGAEAEGGEKAWESHSQKGGMPWPGAGSPATSLFLRRLRVEKVWERKLLCKHGASVWGWGWLPCLCVIFSQCPCACAEARSKEQGPRVLGSIENS